MTIHKILLIENRPSDASLVKHAIIGGSLSCELLIVDNRTNAVRFLLQNGRMDGKLGGDLPDLILVGLDEPKTELVKLLKWIRTKQHTKCIPIVILTSNANEEEMQTVYRLGANSYVEKPTDFGGFQLLLKNIGTYWLQINRLPVRNSANEKYQTNTSH
jgi:two-component system, response regulator